MSTKNISIIPNPLEIIELSGWFELRPETVINLTTTILGREPHRQNLRRWFLLFALS